MHTGDAIINIDVRILYAFVGTQKYEYANIAAQWLHVINSIIAINLLIVYIVDWIKLLA